METKDLISHKEFLAATRRAKRMQATTPMAVAVQPQAPASIATRGLGLGGIKVLAQKHVFRPVPIVIANAHGKGRGKLGFTREGDSDYSIAAVEEHH